MGWFRGVTGSIAVALTATLVSPGVAVAVGDTPLITSFAPAVAGAGSVVTVQGSGLDPASGISAQVNGVSAQITTGADTGLEIVIPAGAGSGPISVSGPTGQGSSQADLYIPPAGVTVDQVAVAQRVESGTSVPVALAASGQVGLLTMPLAAGERIAVDVTVSTFGNSTSYARVSILGPDGTAVVAPTGFASSGVFLEPAVATQDGTYTVVVDPQGTRVGSANVTVYRVPADVVVSAVVGGDSVVVGTSVPGQNGRVVFAGVAGQKVRLSLSGSTLGTSSTAVQVLGPDGSVLTSKAFTATSLLVDGLTLPADGDYTIVINPYRAVTGAVSVQVSDVTPVVVHGAADGRDVVVSTGVAGQNGEVRFDAVAGDRLAVQTVASTFGTSSSTMVKLSLVSPSGVTVIAATSSAAGSFIEPVVLPVSGEYRLVVDPQGSTTGSVTLRLHTVPADVVVSGVVGGDPVTVSTSVPGQNGKVVFAGVAGQKVRLSLSGSTLGTSSTAVQVLQPDGSVLTSKSFTATSLLIDGLTLPVDGDYTIVIDPPGVGTGTVDVLVSDVLLVVVHGAADGTDVVVSTELSGQNGEVTFDAVAGDRVAVETVASTFGTSSSTMVKLSLVSPSGATVIAATSSATGYFIEPVELAETGQYRLVVDPQGSTTGSVTLRLHTVPADVVVSGVVGGDSVVVGTTVSGQHGKVVFAGTVGQKVAVKLSGSTLGTSSTSVRVLNPDGSVLMSTSLTGASGFIDAFPLPADGDYTIVIDPYRAVTGQVTVSVSDLSPLVTFGVADGRDVAVPTGTSGQDGEVRFDGVAGDRLAVETVASTFSSSWSWRLSLISPTGATVIAPQRSESGSFIEPIELSETGQYRLVVHPTGSQAGWITFRLHTVPADVVVSAVVDGDAVDLATTVPGQNGKVVFAGTAGQSVALTFLSTLFEN